jgi:hypothetical protein
MQADAGALQANSLADALKLRAQPRDDTPPSFQTASVDQAGAKKGMRAAKAAPDAEPPIDGSRAALLLYINQLPDTAMAAADGQAAAGRKSAAGRRAAPVPAATQGLDFGAIEAKLARLRQASAPKEPAVAARPADSGPASKEPKAAKVVVEVAKVAAKAAKASPRSSAKARRAKS